MVGPPGRVVTSGLTVDVLARWWVVKGLITKVLIWLPRDLEQDLKAKSLPDKDRFSRLRSEKKHFIDTIKLIAYRAETALAQLAREKIKRLDEARSLIRQLFRTEVDLIPDQQNKTLTVRLHPMTTQAHDEIVRHICAEITATEIVFPGTDLRLIYEISSSR